MAKDPGIRIKYVGTKQQIADILTKGCFTSQQWEALLRLAQIGKSGKKKNIDLKDALAARYMGKTKRKSKRELQAIFVFAVFCYN